MDYQNNSCLTDSATINIITDCPQDILKTFSEDYDFIFSGTDIENSLTLKPLRLNKEKAKIASQIIGCKTKLASTISDLIITHFINSSEEYLAKTSRSSPNRLGIYTTFEKFSKVLRKILQEHSLTKE